MNHLKCFLSPSLQSNINRMRLFSSQSKNVNIFAAVCMERPAVIAPPLNIIEKTMHELYDEHEVIKSLLSDHEIRHLEDV